MEYIEQLEQGRYGSFELKKLVGRNLLRGLIFSVLVHAAVVASPYVAGLFRHEEEIPRHIVVIDQTVLTKLKSQQNTPKQIEIARPKIAPPKAAVPIAVPEEQIQEQQQLMPTQQEWVEIMSSGSEDSLTISPGDVVVAGEEEMPKPGIFVPHEVEPTKLPDFCPDPAFPEMAKLAGVQGKVVAYLLVDKKGEVKQWKIVSEKPPDLGFGDEVIKVVQKWKFAPALQQGRPVALWASITFNFKYKK